MTRLYRVRCSGCGRFIDGNGFPSGTGEFKTQKAARAAIETHGVHVSYAPWFCKNYTGEGVLTNDSGVAIKEVSA